MHEIILKYLCKYLSVLGVIRTKYDFQISNLHKKNPQENMTFSICTVWRWVLKQYELDNIIP